MKTLRYKYWFIALIFGATLGLSSCLGDLDRDLIDPDEEVADIVYGAELIKYKQGLAKIYSGLAITGNKGGDDKVDVVGVDGGSQASFLRGLWNHQELPTDEAHCCWGDVGIPELNNISWNSSNKFVKGLYYRLAYQIVIVNEFLRETTPEKLIARGCTQEVQDEIKVYRAEARFLRAFAYYYNIDLFRNVPFTDENSVVGVAPSQIMAPELFKYIETELTECVNDMIEPFVGYNNKDYGRAHKAAAWALLARLYLNAEVYIGENKYAKCAEYCDKVTAVGYELEPVYADMFKSDNDRSKEMIYPIRYEGDATQTWGGMTFLLCSGTPSALKDEINAKDAWQGNRARSSLLSIFEKEDSYTDDTRYSMLRLDQTESIEIYSTSLYLNNGIPVVKFSNVNKDGSKPGGTEAYTDFPMFRLADVYLMYAECAVRGHADKDIAEGYVNELRLRAYDGNPSALIDKENITLDFLLDERGREFFHEAQRRTDLIRFGKFTGSSYLWTWKGGNFAGRGVRDIYKVFPIPSEDINVNPNLKQNDGY